MNWFKKEMRNLWANLLVVTICFDNSELTLVKISFFLCILFYTVISFVWRIKELQKFFFSVANCQLCSLKPSKFSKVLYGRVSGAGVRQEYAVLRASKTELSSPADQVDRHERVPVSAAHPRRRQDATRHLQESTKCWHRPTVRLLRHAEQRQGICDLNILAELRQITIYVGVWVKV